MFLQITRSLHSRACQIHRWIGSSVVANVTPSKVASNLFRISEPQQRVFHSHGWAAGPCETQNAVVGQWDLRRRSSSVKQEVEHCDRADGENCHIRKSVLPGNVKIASKAPTRLAALKRTNIFQRFI